MNRFNKSNPSILNFTTIWRKLDELSTDVETINNTPAPVAENFFNTDFTATEDRSHDLNGNFLTFHKAGQFQVLSGDFAEQAPRATFTVANSELTLNWGFTNESSFSRVQVLPSSARLWAINNNIGEGHQFIVGTDSIKITPTGSNFATIVVENMDAGSNTDELIVIGSDNTLRKRPYSIPTFNGDEGAPEGSIQFDNDFIYIKTSDGWKKAALAAV